MAVMSRMSARAQIHSCCRALCCWFSRSRVRLVGLLIASGPSQVKRSQATTTTAPRRLPVAPSLLPDQCLELSDSGRRAGRSVLAAANQRARYRGLARAARRIGPWIATGKASTPSTSSARTARRSACSSTTRRLWWRNRCRRHSPPYRSLPERGPPVALTLT